MDTIRSLGFKSSIRISWPMGLSKLFLVAQLAPSLVLEKRICQEFLITTRDNYQQFASAEHRKFVAARCHF